MKITEYYDDRPTDARVWYASAVPNFQRIPASELPSGVAIGYTFDGLVINPNDYLPYLAKKLKDRGVKFIHRELHSLKELKDLTDASIIVNASGAGASSLANDPSAIRVRGQTMFIKCDASFLTQAIIRQGSEYTYVIPRASDGGVILGGFRQPDNFDIGPDLSLRADILKRVNEMTGGRFEWVDLDRDVARNIVGFRPGRTGGMRVEREGDVVHAYGVDGLGYVYAHGIAGRVRELAKGREAKL